MDYEIYYKPAATDSLRRLSPEVGRRIAAKIQRMRHDLAGDVKRLQAYIPDYRLRVGDWRVLFEVREARIIVHDIRHRSNAYDR